MNTEKKYADGITRRAALATIGSALVPACSDKKPEALKAADQKNIYTILSLHELRNQNGEIVKADKLREDYDNKFATFSVSFMGCSNDSCPLTNQKLATLGENDNVVHFVINLNPEMDGGLSFKNPNDAQTARNSFGNYIRGLGVKGKIEFLYPRNTEETKAIMKAVGIITDLSSDPQLHASDMALYLPGGTLHSTRVGAKKEHTLDIWLQQINKPPKENTR